MDALKSALGVGGGANGEGSSTTVGGSTTFAGYDWICVHDDGTYKYLMTKYVIGAVSFGIYGSTTAWAASQAYLMCQIFASFIGVTGNSKYGDITIENVVCKCFLPTYNQMNGGFSYFNSNDRRISRDVTGVAHMCWTSSLDNTGRPYCVDEYGNLAGHNFPSYAEGFRPCVALRK